VPVVETDVIGRFEAAQPLQTSRRLRVEGMARTCIGVKGAEDTPTTRDINRVFQGMSTSYNFWLDNGLALVGNPATVVRQHKVQHQ
jgi:hypothetical protein